jgi:geranylgeranyl diphosphate synthase type I
MGQPWFERFSDRLAAVEAEMRTNLPPAALPSLVPFYAMMAYHLGWQDAAFQPVRSRAGKLLRPLLCLLASEAVGGPWQQALPAAAAVELVHNFTLIHDDVEDNSPLRRGRPAVWSQWGVSQAINAGDGLFTVGRLALFRLRGQGLPAEVILQAVEVLDRAILRICEGQYLDLSFEGRLDVDEAAYSEMIARKTAALVEAAMHLGALVGGGSPAAAAALRAYGHALGLAFQVQDDILGVWGAEEHTGKPAAADLYGRKLGLPAVQSLARVTGEDRPILERVYGGVGPVTEEDVAAVLGVLQRAGTRECLEKVVGQYHALSLASLEGVPAGPAREALREIPAALLGREA